MNVKTFQRFLHYFLFVKAIGYDMGLNSPTGLDEIYYLKSLPGALKIDYKLCYYF